MFFPKKFTFLQYWLQLKNPLEQSPLAKQYNYQTRGFYSLVNARGSKETLHVSEASQGQITSNGGSKPFSIASLHRKSESLNYFRRPESTSAQASYYINHTNSFTTPILLGQLFSQPKPWYNYWILPFVGFITMLPTLTSYKESHAFFNINNSNYGFKNLNFRKTQLVASKSTNVLTETAPSKVEKKGSQIQPLTPFYSLTSTKDLGIFPNNLRKGASSINITFFKPLWSKSNLISLPEDRAATAILQTIQSNQIDARPFTTESAKNEPTQTRNNYSKLSNLLSFTSSKTHGQDGRLYIASQDKSPASSYKTLELMFDSLAKQLFYSKDLSFQKAFLTKASSLAFSSVFNISHQGAGTSTLLQVLQKNARTNQSQSPVQAFQTSSYRFLPAYQDAFYFSTYIAKTSYSVTSKHNVAIIEFSPKPSDAIFRIKTSCFTKVKIANHLNIFENNLNEGKVIKQSYLGDFRGRVGNESLSSSIQTSNSPLFPYSNTSYIQSLDIQPPHSPESQKIGGTRSILISPKASEIRTNTTTPVEKVDFSKDTFQKYFHYMHSRLLLTLQSVNYYQDKQLNIQPHLVLNAKKGSKVRETHLELVNYKPYSFTQLLNTPEGKNLPLDNKSFPSQTDVLQKTKNANRPLYVRQVNHFKVTRKSRSSQEKFIRNFSLNAAIQNVKIGEKTIFQKNEKYNQVQSHTKHFQNLLRKAYYSQEVKKSNQSIKQRGALQSSQRPRTNYQTQTQLNLQPIDLLRLKHFIFLSNQEKRQYKHYPTLDVILKDEKLLYETLLRQNQKQKRRKKKRKRWTRRRRKRKRKLLRPIWTTIQLVKVLNARRLSQAPLTDARVAKDPNKSSLIAPVSRTTSSTDLTQQIKSLNDELVLSKSMVYSTKQAYRLSKKSLVELTNNKLWKIKVKTLLKEFETGQVAKTKRWVKTELLNRLILDTSLTSEFSKGRVGSQKESKIKLASKIEPSVLLEYNRIMYERLQAFYLNYGSNIDKNSYKQQGLLPTLASRASYSKINSFHTKLLYNAPKEEWLWLFKYITGEIPAHPVNSAKDQLRSIWAMNKLQSTNQWTGWKNFYYQEFKKGLTPTYELWQDKKPDKRYNVNNLKKRQYKHLKQLQRLRLSPQLHRGTYFALQRDITKLTILGSSYKKLENHLTEKTFINRPIDKLRLTLQTLKSHSNNNAVEVQKPYSYLTYEEQTKKVTSNSSFITSSKKPILDLYASWWDNTDSTSWGWKTIQYGAPWDRKTLYIPSKLTNQDSIKYTSILNESSILNPNNNWFTTSHLTDSNLNYTVTAPENFSSFILVLLATLIFHICAFLGLLSLAEVRYSTKVNLILAYKLSALPLKLLNTVIQPVVYAQRTKPQAKASELSFGNNPQQLLFNQNHTSRVFHSTLQLSKVAAPTPILVNESNFRTPFVFTTTINKSLSLYKYGFYGSLKQLIKKVLRHKTSRSQVNELLTTSVGSVVTQTMGGGTEIPISELSKLEQQKLVLKTMVNNAKLRKVGLQLSYSTYYGTINLVESFIDYFRDTTRSVYDFFSLPENFSPNPDEVGLDVLANFIYDFEEPLIELLPDIIETESEKYFDRYLLSLNLFGPAGLFVHQRWKWFYRMFVGLMYQADADYRKDEEEFHCLYTIWADILNQAAEDLDLEATVIASQEDQRILLLEHLLVSNLLEQRNSYSRNINPDHIYFRDILLGLNQGSLDTQASARGVDFETTTRSHNQAVGSREFFRSRHYKNVIKRLNTTQSNQTRVHALLETLSNRMELASRNSRNLRLRRLHGTESDTTGFPTDQVSKSHFANSQFVATWSADQYVLYKTDETDLFIEINVPKSFASIPSIKHWDTLHQTLGMATCHIYSGLLTKQMAKNILLIADNTAEKTQILQALAGETEVKLIMDNSSRYASISQSVAVGMRLLRDVFDAVALQTPCIFVLEDIHLIGEKRPFLISDEDLALVTTSGLGLEQHQLYEKIQKIQQHSKHRISYFKKAYRGDAADSLPTNLLCYDLFLTDQPRTEWISPNYPIPMDFHTELNDLQQGEFRSDTRKEKFIHASRPISHLLLSETQISNDSTTRKISHFVNDAILSTKFDENQQKQNTSLSLRSKVSAIADGALNNISVKLDRITQLLVIMDNVRKNKGFIVFGTTNKPQILDPALRRPGRLEETIYLPSIPNILTKWETLTSQIKSSSGFPIKSSHSPITLDLFSVYTSMQKIPIIKQKNLVFTLANSISTNNSNYKKIVEKQTSIVKMQFINHLLIESRNRLQEDKNARQNATPLVPFGRLKTNLEMLRRKKFLSEIVGTSYQHIAKSLVETLTRQTSTNILLLKSGGLQKQVGHLEDTIYRKLYSDKALFKNDLIYVFAGIIGNYFASVGTLETQSKTIFCNPFDSSDTTKDPNWQIATTLLYSYIQKRSLYNKNAYIQKLFNRSYGSISGFPGPPITSLLLPAKRYENYLRAERDYEQPSFSHRTLSLQNKIQFHLNQRVLKRLYRLPIKEFYKSEIIENSLTTFSSSNFVLPKNSRNFAQQNIQSKTNFYYRNIFLTRHRHYLTTQWWTGHLPEYNIENTVMSEIDFRSYFVDKTKVRGFTGDLILDFPDADQYYNLKHRRWYLQSTSWKSWYDLEKGLTTEIMNHYIVEFYTQTYRLLDNNRELLDHYVAKLLKNYQLQELELIADLKQFT